MRIPNLEECEVPEKKVVEYLLNLSHRDGRSKAEFFRSFGFSEDNWILFSNALKAHAAKNDVTSTEDTEFGTKYIVDGELEVPAGVKPAVRVVWFVEEGESRPRLVTAHPLPRRLI